MSTQIRDNSGFSRREFLKVSGLSAGGLVIGVSLPAGVLVAGEDAVFEPGAFIHIAKDGATTLYCGRCEMGQGISTALPAAVADELEADWARVNVLQGDGDPKYGPQDTGGSASIHRMFEPMRKAGAAAREVLVAAAASAWSLPVADCYAKKHVVYNKADKRSLAYGDLVEAASKLSVPDEPKLKTRDQFRYIGQPLPRHDQDEMVVGKRVYGADVKLPGMKYAAVKHAPVFGGKFTSLNADKALAMPGVVKVVEIPRFENPYGTVGGVAIVADNTWTAQRALDLVEVEFEPGDNSGHDTDAYMKELVQRVEAPAKVEFEKGALDDALENAATRHAATYTSGYLSHSPIEPMACAVWVKDGECEVWASTQDPMGIRNTIAAYLGLDAEKVTAHVMASGGAFGRKFKCDYVVEAAACSKAVGAPVQLTWTREEDTRTGYYAPCNAQHIEASLDAGGKLTGWLHRAAFPVITSIFNPAAEQPSADDLGAVSKHLYGVPNMRVESGLAKAHTRIGWLRSVYHIFYAFGINAFTDELAHAAGMNMVQLLHKIYDANTDPEQQEQVKRSRGVLDKVVEMSGFGKDLPANHGIGLAVHHSFRSYAAMAAHVEVNGGKVAVHRVDCAVDCGLVLNPDIATAQM
ncbi:MAG: molybdopterin-dependent oxidoreductase, partial [Lysobacterales bacterium]